MSDPIVPAPSTTTEPAGSEPAGPIPGGEGPAAAATDGPSAAPSTEAEKDQAELNLPPDVEAAMDQFIDGESKPEELRFAFRYQPWEEVLQWFADQCDLSLLVEVPPAGTFNYTDSRSYTPAEAIDLLNSVLLIKGYTLVRRDRMLIVINLEDGIPPNLVTDVPVAELDERGEFELIRVVFQLNKFEPQDASTEIAKLIGPQGSVVVLPKTRQIQVTETAGRLRTIRDLIERVEDPQGLLSGELETYEFKHILPDEGLLILRQLMGIATDANTTQDDTFRFAMDSMGMRLFFSGSAEKVGKARKILEAIDVASGGDEASATTEALQLEVYPIAVADPDSVLKVMQTLLEGLPGVRLSIDPKTGSLVALARPSDHATIRATIDQMQSEIRRIEVIPLQRTDPQLAAVSIRKMFGDASATTTTTRSSSGAPSPTISSAPTVEPDTAGRQLIVHGTENQISQIRVLLGKMGEPEFAEGDVVSRGDRIRILPITGTSAETALENLRMIWPTISDNPIKEVTPSAIMPSLKEPQAIPQHVPGKGIEPSGPREPEFGLPGLPGGIPGLYRPSRGPMRQGIPSGEAAPPDGKPVDDRQTSDEAGGPFRLVAETRESEIAPAAEAPDAAQPAVEAPGAAPPAADEVPAPAASSASP
ncbi:MAG: hypothetical protein ACYC6Y_20850, partial [Thermoguttaceae bacterium]